jgi:transposase
LSEKLGELGFSERERCLAEAVVIGRLISPGSEVATWDWIRNISSIGELTEGSLEKTGLNPVYCIGDKIVEHKEEIEDHLFKKEKEMYPCRSMLYLFALTNFYFEGQALGNSLAKRRKSKEKRNDCPLVSLGLIVDSDGFPIASKIFPGNISDPKSLSRILEEMGLLDDILPFSRPTLVMDRGIATLENIVFLRERQFPYILITRGPSNATYLEEFEKQEIDPAFVTFERNGRKIKVKKLPGEKPGTVEVLCISEGKKEKERAISRLWTERASEDLSNLQRSVRKGSMKSIEKINRKIGRLEERYAGLKKHFMINVVNDKAKAGYAADVVFLQVPVFDIDINDEDPLLGTYVIESSFEEKSAEEIWLLYMTLTRVEAAFRSMKTDLGTRPIYHQIARRTKGHLFISVLAYHILINIEYRLTKNNDMRQWKTIRKILSTHQRSTIIITDVKNQIHHLRIAAQPEPCHQEIYEKLNISPAKYARKYFIAKRL